MASDLMKLTTSIVTSYLANNKMPSEDVFSFVERVFKTLDRLDKNHASDLGGRSTSPVASAATRNEAEDVAQWPVVSRPSETPARVVPKTSESFADGAEEPRRPVGRPRKNLVVQPERGTASDPIAVKRANKTFRASPKSTRNFADGVNPEDWPGVFEDRIVCLEDQVETTLLRAYVRNRYGLSFDQYKEKWSLPADYPYAPPEYTKRKREFAQESGLGTKLRPKSQQVSAPAPRRKPGTLSPAWARSQAE